MKVGFVGLGHMGRPMAARLLAAGLPIVVFDVRSEATAALDAEAATSLADLARQSDAVITMLPTGDAVSAAALGPAGSGDRLLEGLRPGAVLIDMGSSSPTRMVYAARAELRESCTGISSSGALDSSVDWSASL